MHGPFALICPMANSLAMCMAAGMTVGVASPCGRLRGKKIFQAGKVGRWAGPAGWVRKETLEDYKGIPDTNVTGCSPWLKGPTSQLGI